jgi:hypothetical protein
VAYLHVGLLSPAAACHRPKGIEGSQPRRLWSARSPVMAPGLNGSQNGPQGALCGPSASQSPPSIHEMLRYCPASLSVSGVFARVRWCSGVTSQSGRPDSNRRSPHPKCGAIPDFATPRCNVESTATRRARDPSTPVVARETACRLPGPAAHRAGNATCGLTAGCYSTCAAA